MTVHKLSKYRIKSWQQAEDCEDVLFVVEERHQVGELRLLASALIADAVMLRDFSDQDIRCIRFAAR